MTKKKTTKKTASRKASATASASLPPGSNIPEGMKQMGGGYAPNWSPEVGDSIHGPVVSDVRTVELKYGRRKVERRVVEVDNGGTRVALWESAALSDLFDAIEQHGQGFTIFVQFDGLGKKKAGQNPPKLFTVATAA